MPPKPQVFKTPDGKEFASKAEWRDYMVETFYSFKNKKNEPEPLIKTSGSVEGQMFTIENCEDCTLVLCDHSEQIHVDNLKNCRVMIGACASSIFIRNCENCVFYTCSQQLRLRECYRSSFYVMSIAEVHIEMSNNVKFGPFRGGYPDHAAHLKTARLDTAHNLWYDIYDHNDALKTRENWALIEPAQYEAPWFPLGECEIAIKPTAPGEVDRTKDSDSNMASFTLEQMKLDSSKSASAAPPAEVPVPPPATAADAAAAAPVATAVPTIEAQPPAPPVVETLAALEAAGEATGGEPVAVMMSPHHDASADAITAMDALGVPADAPLPSLPTPPGGAL